ncbi:MAG: sialate O-acetylesterase [Phycisphaeraceae bacterium]
MSRSFYQLIAAAFAALLALPALATDYDLYVLAGQSNMDGYGLIKDLEEADRGPVAGVHIFHGSPTPDKVPLGAAGLWQPLRPGHGRGFKSNGAANQYSNAFGPELFFAKTLRQANPNRPIAIVKYSRGGTSIHQAVARHFGCWEPDFTGGEGKGKGINQYDHFLSTLDAALAVRDIDGDGEDDHLIPAGILWMQGESDAHAKVSADAYQANLKRLMDLMRAALRCDDLPVVIGRISDSGQDKKDGKVWDFGETVRKAQAGFVKEDPSAALVTETDKYGYSDPYHYDTAGFIDLGKQFALSMLGLHGAKPGEPSR